MAICTCPLGAEISDITIPDCPEYLGQIQKILFQRTYLTGSTENKVVIGTDDPTLLATWTTLLAAATGAKVVPSPWVNNPTNEAGEPTTFGGGNATVNGSEIVLAPTSAKFTGEFHNVPQSTIKEIKTMSCETLSVYLVNGAGQIIGVNNGASTPVDFKGIRVEVNTMDVSDKILGGLEAPDMNNIRFSFPANWSDNLHIVTGTDFNGLDLVSP